VFVADDVPVSDLVPERHLADCGLQQVVLGQRAPGRMAVVAARVTVQHLALLAQHGGVGCRFAFAQLALGNDVPELAIAVDDVPHRPVLGQVVRAVVVEVHGLPASRTRQRIRAGHDRWERDDASADVAGRAQVAVRPAVAHHAAVRLAEYGQLVRLWMAAVGRVRLGRAATAGRRVTAVLLRRGRLQRPLRVHRTVQAQSMVARQQHRVVEQLLAGNAVQFVFHSGGQTDYSRQEETGNFVSIVFETGNGKYDRRRAIGQQNSSHRGKSSGRLCEKNQRTYLPIYYIQINTVIRRFAILFCVYSMYPRHGAQTHDGTKHTLDKN